MTRVYECKPHHFATVDEKVMERHINDYVAHNKQVLDYNATAGPAEMQELIPCNITQVER